MSKNYKPGKEMFLPQLFDGRLAEAGVTEYWHHKFTTDLCRILTDGDDFVWVTCDDQDRISYFTTGDDGSTVILNAIRRAFQTRIVFEGNQEGLGASP